MARQFWAGEDPIGKRLVIHERTQSMLTIEQHTAEVVGVAQDTVRRVLEEDREVEPFLYAPAYWLPSPGGVLGITLRTDIDPLGVVTGLRGAVASLDPDLVVEVRTVTEWIQSNFESERASASLSGIAGLLAVLLASIGVYVVMAHAASQRTHEIGIRMALGARSRDVLTVVMREGMVTTLMGVAIGIGAAFWDDASDRQSALRRDSHRSSHVRHGDRGVDRRSPARLLHPRPPRDEGGPTGGPEV